MKRKKVLIEDISIILYFVTYFAVIAILLYRLFTITL